MRMISASRARPRLKDASVDASAATRMNAECLSCLGSSQLLPCQRRHSPHSALHTNYFSLTGDITEALRQNHGKPRHYWDSSCLKSEILTEALLKLAEANCLQVRTLAPVTAITAGVPQ